MRRLGPWLLGLSIGLCLVLGLQGDGPAKPKAMAYFAAWIYTAAGEPIQDGILLVEDGKIVAVGPKDRVTVPEGVTVREFPGATIIPGLVDTHSHIGIWPRPHVPANEDGNEGS